MRSKRKFWKTVITLEVLSEDEPIDDSEGLLEIYDEITYGACSGISNVVKQQQLTPKEAAEALIKQGSDPEFFGIDEDGNEVED